MSRVKGVAPGFLLLPAREYEWNLKQKIEIRLPLKGTIAEVIKKDTTLKGVLIGGDNEFSLFEDNLLLLWELVRVLFAEAKYPYLENDECLNVVALSFTEDEVILHGEVIQSVDSGENDS